MDSLFCRFTLSSELTVGRDAPSAPPTESARRGGRGASVARPAARLNSFESIKESKRCSRICTPASGAANEGQRSLTGANSAVLLNKTLESARV